jgi:hypothetical protein
MMRLIQKLDKFGTNNQNIDQISKFDSSYQKSNIAWCIIYSIFKKTIGCHALILLNWQY